MRRSWDEGIAVVALLLHGIRPTFALTAAKRGLLVVTLAILAAAGYAFAAPSTGEAAPCGIGTVAAYILLGSTGCTIDDKIFSNFAYETSTAGVGIPILAGGVLVTPLDTPGNPGLTFTAPWIATGTSVDTAATQSLIFFDVRTISGEALIEDASVNAVFSGTGAFSDDVSEFGCFGASSTTGCSGASGSFFLTMNDQSGTLTNPSGDSKSFTPVALVGVNFVSIAASTSAVGAGNTAIVTSATYRFSEVVPTRVPEPGTGALFGTALVGLVGPRLLRHRRYSHMV